MMVAYLVLTAIQGGAIKRNPFIFLTVYLYEIIKDESVIALFVASFHNFYECVFREESDVVWFVPRGIWLSIMTV